MNDFHARDAMLLEMVIPVVRKHFLELCRTQSLQDIVADYLPRLEGANQSLNVLYQTATDAGNARGYFTIKQNEHIFPALRQIRAYEYKKLEMNAENEVVTHLITAAIHLYAAQQNAMHISHP